MVWYKIRITEKNVSTYSIYVQSIFQNAFGREGWNLASIKRSLLTASLVYFLKSETGDHLGYFMGNFGGLKLQDKQVISLDKAALHSSVQRKGHFRKLVVVLVNSENELGWIVGRSQNVAIFRLLQNVHDGILFPFDAPFPSEMKSFCQSCFRQAEGMNNEGLIKGCYSGRLNTNMDRKVVDDFLFRQSYAPAGFDPDSGDGIFMLKRVL